MSERKQSAMGIIVMALLAVASGVGAWVATSVKSHGEELVALRYEVKELRKELAALERGIWTVGAQVQYNAELNALNQTLKVPDVRRIAREQ
jgi:hypothetical protein